MTTQRSLNLTTISVVYETLAYILMAEGMSDKAVATFGNPKRAIAPEEDEIEMAYEHAEKWWDTILQGLTLYRDALKDLKTLPELRSKYLLFKPAGQTAFILGLSFIVKNGWLPLEEATERANNVDWDMTADHWELVIMNTNGTINAYKEARERTAWLIAYLIAGDEMPTDIVSRVGKEFASARGEKVEPGKEIEYLPKYVAA
jgi:hypothetical protein